MNKTTIWFGITSLFLASCADLAQSLPGYDAVLVSEYASEITNVQVAYPNGSVFPTGRLVPRASSGWGRFSGGVPKTAVVSWVDPMGQPKSITVDVRNQIPKNTVEGDIIFTIKPDETVAVSFRE
jgi:hypothetical protein